MRAFTIRAKPSPISTADIIAVEQAFKITFPDFFKAFLLLYQGASVVENTYKVTPFSCFLPLRSTRSASIELILNGYKADYDTNLWLPFAIDAGGWVFVISLAADTYGQVWLDRCNYGEEPPFVYVDSSFETFLDQMQESN